MNDKQVDITRVINAPIDKVWDAWTNPESMKQWYSPEVMQVPEVDVDLSVGGTYRVVMQSTEKTDEQYKGTHVVGGEFLEIDKPNKLVYTWLWEGAPKETHTTTVTVSLKKIDDDKTEVTINHKGFPDDNMQKEHNMGWTSTFNNLEKFIGA